MSLSLISSSFAGATELWKFGTQERTVRGAPLNLGFLLVGDVGGPRYTTVRLQGAAAGYSVTAGKTLVLTRLVFVPNSGGAGLNTGYSDSDRGLQNAADGANPVNLDIVSGAALTWSQGVTGGVIYSNDVYYEVPAGKFPRVWIATGTSAVWGYFLGHEV